MGVLSYGLSVLYVYMKSPELKWNSYMRSIVKDAGKIWLVHCMADSLCYTFLLQESGQTKNVVLIAYLACSCRNLTCLFDIDRQLKTSQLQCLKSSPQRYFPPYNSFPKDENLRDASASIRTSMDIP